MNIKYRFALTLSVFMLCAFSLTSQAQTAQRTFVSTQGNDANTASLCGRNTPCRGFAAAISAVTAGGEVVALDSGGYGAVTISKSVKLVSPTGVYAAITATSGNAITITAGATDTVVLRGLTLNGLGGANGIDFQTGAKLYVESCVIDGFVSNTSLPGGIRVDRNIGGNTTEVFLKDSIMRNNTNGVTFRNTADGGLVIAAIDNCRFEGNIANGVLAANNSRVTVRGSFSAGNNSGFAAQTNATGQSVELHIEGCVATNNRGAGIFSGSINVGHVSIIYLSNSTSTYNEYGVRILPGGQVFTRGNNLVRGNTTADVSGALNTVSGT